MISRIAHPLALTLLAFALVPMTGAFGATAPLRVAVQPVDARGRPLQGPGYFVVTTRPGHHVHLYARLSNDGTVSGTVTLLPVDTRRSANGNISYDLPDQPRRQVGAWVRADPPRVQLRPGQSRVATLVMKIPAQLPPGTYIGALTVSVPTTGSEQKHGAVIDVQTRLAVAIVVSVQRSQGAGG